MMTDIDKYLSFVLTMFVAFGITFEVPVVVIVLGAHAHRRRWRSCSAIRSYVIVGAFVAGAIFTPPDVVSQLLLAIPLWLLYELGMLIARFVVPRPRRRGAGGARSLAVAGCGSGPVAAARATAPAAAGRR